MKATWIIDEEWMDWYKLTPAERWNETKKLWSFFLSVGGSYDSEPDSQSPFDTHFAQRTRIAHGRTSMRVVRRRGV
jgi:hypothetical protein